MPRKKPTPNTSKDLDLDKQVEEIVESLPEPTPLNEKDCLELMAKYRIAGYNFKHFINQSKYKNEPKDKLKGLWDKR
jgi:hypothetical protein